MSAAGVTALRVGLDWARLQPRPNTLDGDWAEWFDDVLRAVEAVGMEVWVTLHEDAVPRWFDNEGGFGDADALTKWWPRWVERAAERFGDRVHGWVPFASMSPGTPMHPWPPQPWKDTWGILGGSGPAVVASIDVRPDVLAVFQSVERYLGVADRIGVDLTGLLGDLREVTTADGGGADQLAERGSEAVGRAIREVAERAGSTPLTITAVPTGPAADAAGVIEVAVAAIDDALADGIAIDVAFVEPAIGTPDGDAGLVDPDRAPTSAAAVFQVRPR